jgi:hypothetical protein
MCWLSALSAASTFVKDVADHPPCSEGGDAMGLGGGTSKSWVAGVPIAAIACRTPTWIHASKREFSSASVNFVETRLRGWGGADFSLGETLAITALFIEAIATRRLRGNLGRLTYVVRVCLRSLRENVPGRDRAYIVSCRM